ncbi:M48 family metallopeptidase [Pelagerythrobacter marensis]|uniref:M48 family metallopeptidase n=1 Tax=Pelagerythrobacter marensis TaxID=543877 RepID=A0ABZ2D515_9SPHN
MTCRAAAGALLAALLALPSAAASQPAPRGIAASPDPLAADLAALRQADRRLLAIGWRLTTGNAPFCREARPAIGLLLQDIAAYADPAAIRAANGIAGPVAVQAVAPGSPAETAGLRPDDGIAAIDGADPAAIPAGPANDWRRLARLHRMIETSLAANGRVELTLHDGKTLEISGVAACPGRFEVVAGKRAVADGTRVVVGRDFPGFGYREDELAAAIAHELAHNLLGHPEWLNARGRKRRDIRATEREADRLMPWLLANAGYDPHAALRFMQRWGPRHGGGLFRKRTHDGWDERAETIEAEIAQVEARLAQAGEADWSRYFRRAIPD